ncbi:MAG: polysaccharide deacetylase family protein [Cyclobacteriaceae bacterium]
MKPYFFKSPLILSWLFPKAIWRGNVDEKVIYLTFDDGPQQGVTNYVLDLLHSYQAKATFFCVGNALESNSELVDRLISEEHLLANHSYKHENGSLTNTRDYIDSVNHCGDVLKDIGIENRLFRPPYGRLRYSQRKELHKRNMRIVYWSHLSGDFDSKLNVARSIASLKKAGPGSIILFHDSLKAFANLKLLLPEVLEYFSSRDYQFETLSDYAN